MAAVTQTVHLTTNASGAVTINSGTVNGRILGIRYVPGDIATGATLTVTTETTAQAVLTKTSAGTANVWFYPRVLGSKNTDGASTTFFDYIWAAKEALTIVIASGGDTKTGSVLILSDQYPQS
jgi:hypothetical protein